MMPTHDPARDGNVFAWILKAAAEVRELRRDAREDWQRVQAIGQAKTAARLRSAG